MTHGERDDTAGGGQADPPAVDPLADVAVALSALGRVHDWLREQAAAREGQATGQGPADDVSPDALVARQVTVGLGHIDALAMAARIRSIVTAEDLRLAEIDGAASPVEWLADALRMSRAEASRESRDAAVLSDRADTMAALASGQISRTHARQLADAIRQQERDQLAAERARRAEEDRRRRERAEADEEAARRAADEAERARLAAEAAERERALAEQARLEAERRQREADAAKDARQRDLLDQAQSGASAEQLKDAADAERANDPAAMERDAAAQFARRHLRRWRDKVTGLAMTKVGLPDDVDEQLQALLEAARTFDPPQTPPEEQRSREQRDADAFIDILNTAARAGSLPTTHGTRPQVTVTAPLETLLGGDQPGRAGNGTLLSPDPRAVPDELARTGTLSASNRMWGASRPTWKAETVRRLACDANLSRAIVNATGVVLDLGTATSRWSAPQYRAIAASFTGCAFPVTDGTPCDRPISWCEIHHVIFVEDGGPTDLANGVPLCKHHHNAVHHDGWNLGYDQPTHTTTVTRRRRGTTTTRSVDHTHHSPTTRHQKSTPGPVRGQRRSGGRAREPDPDHGVSDHGVSDHGVSHPGRSDYGISDRSRVANPDARLPL